MEAELFTLRLPRRVSLLVSLVVYFVPFCWLLVYLMYRYWPDVVPKLKEVKLEDVPLAVLALCLPLLITVLVLLLTWIATSRLLQEMFPRRLLIDANTRTLSIKNVPFCERRYRFEQIASIEIRNRPMKGSYWIWVCLNVHGLKRVLRILEFSTSQDRLNDDIRTIASPIAKQIADRINAPIREAKLSIWEVFFIAGF